MAKNISTRIGLKIDTLAAWDKSDIVLYAGELAIATVAAGAGSGLTEPVVMIKVGDGEHVFSELAWAVHAKASDVYGWAKKSEADFVNGFLALTNGTQTMAQVLDATYVTGTELTNELNQLKQAILDSSELKNYYTKTEIDVLLGDYYTVDDVDAITGDLTALNTTNKSNLVLAINEALQAVEVGGTGSVVTVTKETTPTEGSHATYSVKQGGKAVGDKIEIPAIPTNVSEFTNDANYATKGELPTDLGDLANTAGYAKTTEVEKLLEDYTKSTDLPTDLGDFTNNAGYAKTNEVEGLLEDYTKTEDLDTTVGGLGYVKVTKVSELENDAGYLVAGDIANKVDSETLQNYYTKTEADAEFATPQEVIDAVNKAIDDVADVESITNITTLVEYANQNAGSIGQIIEEIYGTSIITDGDSRIDTAVNNAAEALDIAGEANATAGTANSVANAAKELAQEAVNTATEAVNGATAKAAEAAQSAADAATAKAGAETAQGLAEGAQAAAEAAQGAAETAKAGAETAQGLAETAQGKAEEAQGAAEDARDAAVAAQGAAETAKGLAETAQGLAETAQGKAEAAQAAAEAARDEAVDANTSATAIANQALELAGTADANATQAKDDAAEALTKVSTLTTDDIDGGEDVWVLYCGTASLVVD